VPPVLPRGPIGPRARAAALLVAAGAGLLAVLSATAACGRGAGDGPRGDAVPGIVLVCLDTLRGDALSASGGDGTRMPALEAFAKTATAFRDASSPASWTAPGVASLLTGVLPSAHGSHGVHDAPPVAASVPTLAESFSAAGWWTGASTAGGWVSAAQGLARGFERFDGDFDAKGAKASVAALGAARPAGKPFFLFLHTYAAHDPYGDKATVDPASDAVPTSLRAEAERLGALADASGGVLPIDDVGTLMTAFLSDAKARAVFGAVMQKRDFARLWAQGMEWVDGRYREAKDPGLVEARLRDAYGRGVRHCDGVVAETLAALDALRLPEGTVVVFTSDHGEAFGEHGYLGHGRHLHDELVRVPLVVRAPGRLPAGTVVRGSCSLLDVAPTLLALAGVPSKGGLHGVSLLPLASGLVHGRPVRGEADPDGTRGGARTPTLERSVRTERRKGILVTDARSRRVVSASVFALDVDPGEQVALPDPGGKRITSTADADGTVHDEAFYAEWNALLDATPR
jgi:arylsulfatase A-like enzyme